MIVLGGGNTAMDCCRSSLRLGGVDVKVVVRSGFAEMKASAWEKEDAMREGIPILNYLVPKAFIHKRGRLTGMAFEKVAAEKDARGRRVLAPTGEPDVHIECDDVLIAVGQENAFPWIETDAGVAFGKDGLPEIDPVTFQSSLPSVFFGGDAALGPKNIITAVAHGHEAAISIDAFCRDEDPQVRPPPMTNLVSQKMGIHEWSYDNAITLDRRFAVPHVEKAKALKNIETEVELGFTDAPGFRRGAALPQLRRRDGLLRARPASNATPASTFVRWTASRSCRTRRRRSCAARSARRRSILRQAIYVSEPVKTGRIMAKDEDLCLHCGLCAERCPTGAWDMQKFTLEIAQAGHACRSGRKRLRHPLRQRQRLRLGERQPVVRALDHAHGRADRPAQHLSLEHPGPADLVRGPGQRGGQPRRAWRRRHDRGDESADLRSGHRRDRAGRLSLLRFDAADPALGALRDDVTVIGMPLTEICTAEYTEPRQRQLYKNIVYVGALAALLDIDLAVVEKLVAETIQGQGAADRGEPAGAAHRLRRGEGPFRLSARHSRAPQRAPSATAFWSKAISPPASARSMAARRSAPGIRSPPRPRSPRPSSAIARGCGSIRRRARRTTPFVQAEDEIAAIGMAVGAGWNGARAFTTTSGPGISLMQEFFGLAYFAEIPVVVFDVQRGGPSTGMPTRTQQSDLLLCAFASHGDTKHVLLMPDGPGEAFEFAASAFDFAERLQTPIFVMLDLDIGMNSHLTQPFRWDDARAYDRGKVLSHDELDRPR